MSIVPGIEKRDFFKQRPRLNSFVSPPVNPFVNEMHLTIKQKLQIAFITVTILPFRIIMVFFTFVLTWLLSVFLTVGMTVPFKEPASQFRVGLFNVLRKLGRLLLFFFGFHKIKVQGKRASAKEAPIVVVAPHSSMFDTFALFVSDPIPSGVSRIENYEAPLFGTLSKAMQPVFVTRNDPQSRRKTILEIKQRVKKPGKWPQIFIFPEGTCTNRKALITFKAGAFIPGCPIQPVLLEFLNKWDTYTWTMTGPSTLQTLWWTLCQWSSEVRITYLPVYNPSHDEKNNAKLYANNVRIMMADALNLPITDHTFEDCRLMRKAAALNLPMESGLVEFAKISQKLGMNIDSVQDKLKEFSKIAGEVEGVISLENFAEYLNVPVSDAVKDMFHLYDRNDSGHIDFREYVIGLSLVSQPAVTEDTVKLAFEVFDKDHNGLISKDEFNQVLRAVFENEINGSEIFDEIKKAHPEHVSYNEFYEFVKKRPEYAKLFVWYREMMPDTISSDELETVSFSTNDDPDTSKDNIDILESAEVRLRKADSVEVETTSKAN